MAFTPAPAVSRFRMEDALQATFASVGANLPVFALLALTLYALPNFAAQLAFRSNPLTAGAAPGLFFTGALVKGIVGLATAAILQGALTRGVIDHLNGIKPRFADCLRTGLVQALPLVAIGLLFGLAVGIGLIFLIAPGLFFVALWSPAGAVRVVERRGVFAAFGRAAELTHGNRWAVLIAMVVVTVLAAVVSSVITALLRLLLSSGDALTTTVAAAGFGPLTPGVVVFLAVSTAFTALASVLTGAAPAAIYSELRRAKEGARPAELSALFD